MSITNKGYIERQIEDMGKAAKVIFLKESESIEKKFEGVTIPDISLLAAASRRERSK